MLFLYFSDRSVGQNTKCAFSFALAISLCFISVVTELFSTVDNFEYAVMKIILSVTNIILAVAYIMFAVYNF